MKLTIQNIESFYNYRTIGDQFKLVTSVLSINRHFIEIKANTSSIKEAAYTVMPEIKVDEVPVNLAHLNLKRLRIAGALCRLKHFIKSTNINAVLNEELFLIFALPSEDAVVEVNMPQSQVRNTINIKPYFCRDLYSMTKTKPSCTECQVVCSYTIENILSFQNSMKKRDIEEELKRHSHPKSRLLKVTENGVDKYVQRSVMQASRELADHYKNGHGKVEPSFI